MCCIYRGDIGCGSKECSQGEREAASLVVRKRGEEDTIDGENNKREDYRWPCSKERSPVRERFLFQPSTDLVSLFAATETYV